MCNEFILWSVSVGKCWIFHENCFSWVSAKKRNLKVNFKWKFLHKSSSGSWLKECAVLRSIYFILKDPNRPLCYEKRVTRRFPYPQIQHVTTINESTSRNVYVRGHSITMWARRRGEGVSRKSKLGHKT